MDKVREYSTWDGIQETPLANRCDGAFRLKRSGDRGTELDMELHNDLTWCTRKKRKVRGHLADQREV